jgi:hypothetical protein
VSSQFPDGVEPAYRITSHLSARVAALFPQWNDPDPRPDVRSLSACLEPCWRDNSGMQEQFVKAVQMCGEDFLREVNYYGRVRGLLPGLSVVPELTKILVSLAAVVAACV